MKHQMNLKSRRELLPVTDPRYQTANKKTETTNPRPVYSDDRLSPPLCDPLTKTVSGKLGFPKKVTLRHLWCNGRE